MPRGHPGASYICISSSLSGLTAHDEKYVIHIQKYKCYGQYQARQLQTNLISYLIIQIETASIDDFCECLFFSIDSYGHLLSTPTQTPNPYTHTPQPNQVC